ncbi:MAG: hypothetical protein AAGF11_31760 [Myxococcota bacterium]
MTYVDRSTIVLLATLLGCPGSEDPMTAPTSGESTGTPGDSADLPSAGDSSSTTHAADSTGDAVDSTGQPPSEDPSVAFLRRLPGLWVAPVTSMTSVGDFPIMAMDIRPADDRTLLSRVDLDADNNLRFAFVIEEHDGEPTLVFRNGGYFLGLLRDTRTTLVDHDPDAQTWRFCAVTAGCDYVDARFSFPADDALTLSTDVMGRPHMHWEGILREDRPLDGDFPYDDTPGGADDPFPPMPSLRVTLSWTDPVIAPVDAWIVVSTTECGPIPGSCHPSRFARTTADAGATSVELVLDQVHAGDYFATALLDHNGNLAGTLFPDSGDLVSLPNQTVEIADRGESTASLSLLVPL